MVDRERVDAHLRGLEELIDDPPPLLSLIILANGRGLMYSHPLLLDAQRSPDRCAASLRLIHAQLDHLAAHFASELSVAERAERG